MSRREYGLWSLLLSVSNCRKAYTVLLTEVGGNPKLEALRWARSVNCYIQLDLSHNLMIAGLAQDARTDGPFKMQMFNVWASTILGGVLGSVLDEPNFR